MRTYCVSRIADTDSRHLSLITRHSSRSGFSLVEVILAVGIVAFAVVGVLTAFPVGIEAARDSRDETTAALIADDVFSRMRSQPYNKVMVPYQGRFQQINLLTYSGWVAGNREGDLNMFYYARDGQPANAASGGNLGGLPTAGAAAKGDDAYFGAQVYVVRQTWTDSSLNFLPGLARVLVRISWPARQPYFNRKFKRDYYSAIADIH